MNLQVFNILDAINREYGSTLNDWAAASFGAEQYQSRISELRKTANHRKCTLEKTEALISGLSEMIGRQTVFDLIKERSANLDFRDRMIMLILALPEKKRKEAEQKIKNL